MEPIERIVITQSAKLLLGWLMERVPSNSKRVESQWAAMRDEAIFEITQAFRQHLKYHEARDQEYADKVRATLNEREAQALFHRLLVEAAQATHRERVRLLACALAGLIAPDVDVETRSKVSRAVLDLEPSDVLALRKAIAAEPFRNPTEPRVGGEALPYQVVAGDLAYEGLIHAGCLAPAYTWGNGVYVTRLGEAMAKTLELWRPAPSHDASGPAPKGGA